MENISFRTKKIVFLGLRNSNGQNESGTVWNSSLEQEFSNSLNSSLNLTKGSQTSNESSLGPGYQEVDASDLIESFQDNSLKDVNSNYSVRNSENSSPSIKQNEIIEVCEVSSYSDEFNLGLGYQEVDIQLVNNCPDTYLKDVTNNLDIKINENNSPVVEHNELSEENSSKEVLGNPISNQNEILDLSLLDLQKREQQIVNISAKDKKHFCTFCKKLYFRLPRHFETVHQDEAKVQNYLKFPKGNSERRKCIDELRKEGDFLFNQSKFNEGYLIVTRQPQKEKNRNASHYMVCSQCKGYYSKLTLRRHFRKCGSNIKSSERNVMKSCRKLTDLCSQKANYSMRNHIFPSLNPDEISKLIKSDDLIVVHGNKLTIRYSSSKHNNPMIRTNLRYLAKVLFEVKRLCNTVKCMRDIFHPARYDAVVESINIIAGFDETSGKYQNPSTASALSTLLKKCAKTLKTELIKEGNTEEQKHVSDFIDLFDEDIAISVNRRAMENLMEKRRSKSIVLPSIDDIKKLNKYVTNQRNLHYNELLSSFSVHSWMHLLEVTLISILVFNRRRPGEIERTLISDFENYERIDGNSYKEIIDSLSKNSRKKIQKYVRFVIRGKLGRTVPVLLHQDLVQSLKLLMKYRTKSGVSENNPYLFGIPGVKNDKYLRACTLMRKFSDACEAVNPTSLRGTQLRKHVATHSVLLNLQEHEVSDLAKFMGHADKIHHDHYRLPIASRDITQMSRLLELAQGDQESVSEESDDNLPDAHFQDPNTSNQNEDFPVDSFVTSQEIVAKNVTRRNVSPIGKVSRRSWTNEEKEAINKHFKVNITCRKNTSLNECQQAILTSPELSKRTPPQIKSYVNNQIKKCHSRKVNRKGWSADENKMMRNIFADHLEERTLPSLIDCRVVLKQYPMLNDRSDKMIKAWVYNELNRMKKKSISQ